MAVTKAVSTVITMSITRFQVCLDFSVIEKYLIIF